MEYLLIPDSVAKMSDGLGNACHFLKSYTQAQSTLLMECAKAQSQKLTELSGRSRLTHLQDSSFLRFPGWKRHNTSSCTLEKKKRYDLAFYYYCQDEENREVSNGPKCKFISWPICLTKYPDSSEDPPNPCTIVLCLHFNFLRALEEIQTYSFDAFFPPPHLLGTSAKQKPPCCLHLITE